MTYLESLFIQNDDITTTGTATHPGPVTTKKFYAKGDEAKSTPK